MNRVRCPKCKLAFETDGPSTTCPYCRFDFDEIASGDYQPSRKRGLKILFRRRPNENSAETILRFFGNFLIIKFLFLIALFAFAAMAGWIYKALN